MSDCLVIAIGNDARGDDALGPLLGAHVQAAGWPGVQCLIDDQLQVEHALDLQASRLVLFVDAACGMDVPCRLSECQSAPDWGAASHRLDPGQLLTVCARLFGPPPPAFVLALAGEQFALGTPPSDKAQASLAAGMAWADALLAQPDAAAWRQRRDVWSRDAS